MNKFLPLVLFSILLTSKGYSESEFRFSVPRNQAAIDVEVGDRDAVVFQLRISRGNPINNLRDPLQLRSLQFTIPSSFRFRFTHFRLLRKDGSELTRSNSGSLRIRNLRLNPNESIDLVVVAEVFSTDPEHACESGVQLSLQSQNIFILDQFGLRLFLPRRTLRGPRINIIC